jgi:[ribosomal protein S5]-alanine N-acetyltransferase
MTIQTKNLILTAHLPRYLRALVQGADAFQNISGLQVAEGIREQLLSASAEFMKKLANAKQADPWQFGFAVIHKIDNVLMGMGGFPGPPSSEGVAEIAYGIAPNYQGQGYATEVANALIDFASRDARVKTICAHTLAKTNASTRVLEKCGFEKVGQTTDPEDGVVVWRWERAAKEMTSV